MLGRHNESHRLQERHSTEKMKASWPDLERFAAHYCTLFTIITAEQNAKENKKFSSSSFFFCSF